MYSDSDAVMIPLMLAGMLAVSLLCALLLRGRSGWIRAIPTAIVALFILALEIEKQRQNLLGIYTPGGFSYYALPLHYCSLFSFLFPLAELCGRRLRRIFLPIAVSTSLAVSAAILVFPQKILYSTSATFLDNFRSFHGFVYHMLVIFYLLLTAILGRYRPARRDLLFTAAAVVAYIAVALPHAYMLNTNYCNFLWSTIPFVEKIRPAVGPVLYHIGHSSVLVGGTVLAGWLYAAIHRLVVKIRKGENTK